MTTRITRREALALGAGLGALGVTGMPAHAQQQFFRIGTGGTGGTYYPLGGIIANAISTDKINVSAVATNGSVANVNGIVGGSMEFGLQPGGHQCLGGHRHRHLRGQAQGRGAARHRQPLSRERAHRRQEGPQIKSVADLKGKRVSIDEPGSGTLVNARAILGVFGVTERDIRPEYLKQNSRGKTEGRFARRLLPDHRLSAGCATELAATNGFDLLPIEGEARDKIMAQYKFFAKDKIPDGVYKDVKGVETISVGAQWITSAKQPEALVYEITKALWSDKTRAALDAGHAKGKAIQKATALARYRHSAASRAPRNSTRKPAW